MKDKIGILTNIEESCGNAAYARHLHKNLEKYYAVRRSTNINDFDGGDVVIVNYHPAVVHVTIDDLKNVKTKGMKSIIILQNSFEGDPKIDEGNLLSFADAIVAHEPMESDKIKYIPHGIVELELPPITLDDVKSKADMFIGTAGFPFAWKRFDVVAEACKKFNKPCLMVAPRSAHENTAEAITAIAGHQGPLAHIHREWLAEEEVIGYLSRCVLNIFWYQSKNQDDTLGQTGSARMGISAKRPMIISKHRKFRTLFDYEDELYIAEKEEDVYKYVDEILTNQKVSKKPNRIFKDMGWSKTSEMYKELIESL
jgi:glycosyltransferase involved in cell wall biosynthesis